MNIDWQKLPNFTPGEFSEDPRKYAEPKLLYDLQHYRILLGEKLRPSPAKGALARINYGSKRSQHHVIVQDGKTIKRSKAVDVFPDCSIFKAWTTAIATGLWGGIGVYFDTKFRGRVSPMLHLDQRPRPLPLLWLRYEGIYVYSYETNFYSDLGKIMEDFA